MVILTVLILGLKYCCHGNLPHYFISDKDVLSRWILRPNVIKLFTAVIYCHSMVFTVIIMFYNAESRYGHGMAVKSFITLDPGSWKLSFYWEHLSEMRNGKMKKKISRAFIFFFNVDDLSVLNWLDCFSLASMPSNFWPQTSNSNRQTWNRPRLFAIGV